ncbi:hypothetical protein OC25_02160 [Pedobacter kyungheensis]|uniref:Uncharacterized protein n=1 Tax=Pedobacter kyungheensis TaxID=1069985 RepID=A0A0C1FXJ9_9SPHI|nr:hypothetical protein OC25_02160 [Pedobacter kyungheensis]
MDQDAYHLKQSGESSRKKSGRSPHADASKYLEISSRSDESVLEGIRIGARIRSVDGKQGVVADVEVLRRYAEVQYYFRLERRAGTILVIK